jgi:hypothetical protein
MSHSLALSLVNEQSEYALELRVHLRVQTVESEPSAAMQ